MHIYYSGNVQGVGFRYTVKSIATGFEVTGAVRNLPDGRVELLAEGAPPELARVTRGDLDRTLRTPESTKLPDTTAHSRH